jgi:hypothetical protein
MATVTLAIADGVIDIVQSEAESKDVLFLHLLEKVAYLMRRAMLAGNNRRRGTRRVVGYTTRVVAELRIVTADLLAAIVAIDVCCHPIVSALSAHEVPDSPPRLTFGASFFPGKQAALDSGKSLFARRSGSRAPTGETVRSPGRNGAASQAK